MQLSALLQPRDPELRATEFRAASGGESAESLRSFGVVFCALWLGMLVFLFFARRRQDALRVRVERIEAALEER